MTPSRKYTTSTAAFYILAAPFIPYFQKNDRSGPCTPNLDVLFPLFLIAVAIVGLVFSTVVRVFGRHKAYTGPALVNGAFLCIFFLLAHFNLV